MDIAHLGVRIDTDGVVRSTRDIREFGDQAARTEKATDGLSRAFRLLGPLVGTITAAFSVRALVQYADAWSDMSSRVGAAIKDMDAAPAMMKRLVDMANASYSPLDQTVTVYARNVGALRDLGYAAEGAADYTEALNHALVITATRGERAESVQNALSKAMATGKLAGDGLEAVLANGGRVAEALAAELGTTVSGLRKMASEGKITGDVIARALTGRLQDLRDEAAEMPATVADAFTRINTNLLEYVGTVDKAVGISGALADMLLGLADGIRGMAEPTIYLLTGLSENFERMAWWAGAAATTVGVQYVASMGLATAATGLLSGALVFLRGAIIGTGVGVLVIILGDIAMKMYAAATATDELGESIEGVTAPANSLFTFLKNGAEATGATFDWLTSGIAAGFVAAFATVYEWYAKLVNAFRSGAEMLGISEKIGMTPGAGMDETWATDLSLKLSNQAKSAGDLAAQKWAATFGARVPELVDVDGIFGGLNTKTFDSTDEMWKSLRGDQPGKPPSLPGTSTKENPYDKLVRGAHEFIAAQQLEQQALGMTAEAANRLRFEQDLLNRAANDNIRLTPGQRQELSALAAEMAAVEERTRSLTEWYNIGRTAFGSFMSDFRRDLMNGTSLWESFGNAAGKALDSIADRAMSMAANGLFDLIFGAFMGGIGGGGGQWGVPGGFGRPGIFGIPGMATGGTVAQAGLSWVGERGPELLNLPRGAQVIPNGPSMAMAANQNGGDIIINNVINVPAGTSPETAPAIAREVTKELRRQLPDAIERHNRNPLRRAG